MVRIVSATILASARDVTRENKTKHLINKLISVRLFNSKWNAYIKLINKKVLNDTYLLFLLKKNVILIFEWARVPAFLHVRAGESRIQISKMAA